MESDDLLCSRNARPPKALIERAHLRIDQATIEKINGDGADARIGDPLASPNEEDRGAVEQRLKCAPRRLAL